MDDLRVQLTATVKVMSLFSGYGGLDMALRMVYPDAETVYVSDIEDGPCRVLAARYPDAINLGDVTAIDWATLEPVDVIIGGSPCQDLSQAGLRAGMRPGTRSGLWESMFTAIKTLRPRLVAWENVEGALSAEAFSLLESEAGRVGGEADRTVLRALGRVLGDLASIGYDAQWTTLRASDVGAAHPRARVFVVAYPAGDLWWIEHGKPRDAITRAVGREKPVVMLPTPTARDWKDTKIRREPHRPGDMDTLSRALTDYGRYAPAISQWEGIMGRPAPSPIIFSPTTGSPQLSHHFTEWMMGLPEGWICDPALWEGYTDTATRNTCLRMAGNGVVPQQASAAIKALSQRATMDASGLNYLDHIYRKAQ